MRDRGIGVFDSGVGGLTVVREIMRLLPEERIVYLGDTARLPYGSKSPKVVDKFSSQALRFLLKQDLKLIVIACNTVSALSLRKLRKSSPLPLIGVLESGAKRGIEVTRNGIIGVIGTKATIRSRAYPKLIRSLDPKVKVISRSCPLLVPLVEEGWSKSKITYQVASIYLKPLLRQNIDTLILGCTHYPLLKGIFQDIVGEKVVLVDSAQEVAKKVKELLRRRNIRKRGGSPEHTFYISDISRRFVHMGRQILGRELNNLREVNLEEW